MPVSRLRRALTSTGTLVIVGGEAGGRVLGGLQRQLGASLLSPFLRQRLGTKAHADDLAVLTGLVDAGQVTRALDRVLPLTAAAIALHVLVQGAVRGKLVLSADPVIEFGLVSDAGPGPTARRSSAVPSVDAH